MNTTTIGPYEAKTRQAVIAIRQRIAYPPKLPVVIPEPPAKRRRGLIPAVNCKDDGPRCRQYSMKRLRQLFDEGMNFNAMADALGVSPSAVNKVVKRLGWVR